MDRPEILSELELLLNKAKITDAVALIKHWLDSAAPGSPEALLANCDRQLRSRIAILIRDVLSRYPTTILGYPMLLNAEPEGGASASQAVLPHPADSTRWPCADLMFLGWAAAQTELPLKLPFRQAESFTISWNQPTAVVALFRTTPHVFDLDDLILPDSWWHSLFQDFHGKLRISARVMLPYPDGFEAARALEAAARRSEIVLNNYFLSDSVWAWASKEGLAFSAGGSRRSEGTCGYDQR